MKSVLARIDLRLNRWDLILFAGLLGAITLGAGLLAIDFALMRQADSVSEIATPIAPRVNAVPAPTNQPPAILPSVTRAPASATPITPLATIAPSTPNRQGAPVPPNHPTFAPGQTCQACHNQIRGGMMGR